MIEAIAVEKKYRVSKKDSEYIADAVGDAFLSHYQGDEKASLKPAFDKSKLNLWGRFIYNRQKYILNGLWNDLPPNDNNVRLEL
jgi:hypothetical protein